MMYHPEYVKDRASEPLNIPETPLSGDEIEFDSSPGRTPSPSLCTRTDFQIDAIDSEDEAKNPLSLGKTLSYRLSTSVASHTFDPCDSITDSNGATWPRRRKKMRPNPTSSDDKRSRFLRSKKFREMREAFSKELVGEDSDDEATFDRRKRLDAVKYEQYLSTLGDLVNFKVVTRPPLPPTERTGCMKTMPFRRMGHTEKQAFAPRVTVLGDRARFDRCDVSTAFAIMSADERASLLFPNFKEREDFHPDEIVEHKVRLGRSGIHGWGGFCVERIEPNEIFLEYKGELIRDLVTDTREARHLRDGKDLYMFRVDTNVVVDATDVGNMGRMVNHSCEPNSLTRCIKSREDGQYHIVLIAGRAIEPGEELSYDYNLEYEKAEDKIVCLCCSRTCRGWMN